MRILKGFFLSSNSSGFSQNRSYLIWQNRFYSQQNPYDYFKMYIVE